MFPAAFDYRAPTTLEEALSILQQSGDEAKLLAGGQSLIPLLKLRLATPALVVDIGRVPGMEGIGRDDGTVRIAARTRHVDVEAARDLRGSLDVLLDAAPQISDPLIRNMGTVGGSLAHADPAGDWGAVMLALGADLVARSATGSRRIDITAFFEGPFTTTLRPDEVLTEIAIPVSGARSGGTYLKLERKVGDFATVGVAVHVELEGDGRIGRAGIGLCAVGPNSLKAVDAEKALAGQQPSADLIAEAARLAAAAAEPQADNRGSVEYKRDVVRVFVQRGLHTAVQRARSGVA
ncbi:MAG TPA: xanthine dehydrogenase family protein subunit M [Candidatus Dormibacteraeota bacterium]|jgi:carbon-monoxide dehydrogenase medium subunit|nr:xanthine dehydrogenase family protein subunit M [Candidatus Dormibacteraeota bacterium]